MSPLDKIYPTSLVPDNKAVRSGVLSLLIGVGTVTIYILQLLRSDILDVMVKLLFKRMVCVK